MTAPTSAELRAAVRENIDVSNEDAILALAADHERLEQELAAVNQLIDAEWHGREVAAEGDVPWQVIVYSLDRARADNRRLEQQNTEALARLGGVSQEVERLTVENDALREREAALVRALFGARPPSENSGWDPDHKHWSAGSRAMAQSPVFAIVLAEHEALLAAERGEAG